MKITNIVLALSLISAASYGATVQSVSFGGSNPSLEGWSVTSGSGGEFNNGSDWALFGSGSQATRSLGGDLAIGQTVAIDLATLGIGTGDFVGVDFRQGATTGIGYNFEGGGSNYNVFSSSGVTDSGVGYSSSFKTITLKRDTATDYTLSIDATNFGSLTLANSTTAINEIRVFNETSGSGNDVLFDNFTVTAVPEPSSAALLGLGGLALILRRRK
ncbi:MAG: PEP-CTERM sorting domain-containing protein [Akkermansiaceae bacterium]